MKLAHFCHSSDIDEDYFIANSIDPLNFSLRFSELQIMMGVWSNMFYPLAVLSVILSCSFFSLLRIQPNQACSIQNSLKIDGVNSLIKFFKEKYLTVLDLQLYFQKSW